MTIIPIVFGAFGTVTIWLLKGLKDLEIKERVETIQTTALLRTVRILRRVQETWRDLCYSDSSERPSALADVKNSQGVNNSNNNNNKKKVKRGIYISGPCKKAKDAIEHEVDGDTNCNLCARYNHQRIEKWTGGLGNKRTRGGHPNYSIIKIGQNTKKDLET